MAKFEGIKHVLLDIEGTICPISFVKDTLFPYALDALPNVLSDSWDSPELEPYISAFPPEHRTSRPALMRHVDELTAQDVKVGYLKNLQGYLWESGYKSGAYSTPLFPDVAPKLKTWKAGDGLDVAIYSSGSVFAQKLLFEHVQGAEGKVDDLRGLICGWFDTGNAGPKLEGESYKKIAEGMKWTTNAVLFLSDNVKEVKAASEAGMKVALLEREGNVPLTNEDRASYAVVQNLDQLEILKG